MLNGADASSLAARCDCVARMRIYPQYRQIKTNGNKEESGCLALSDASTVSLSMGSS